MRRLRPYQVEAIASIEQMLLYERRALVVLATGLGKTVIAASIANSWPRGRVVMLCHRDELIQQSVSKFLDWTGQMPAVEQAEQFSPESSFCRNQFVIASVQSLHEKRLTVDRFNDVGLVICDEAHRAHVLSKSWGRVINEFERKNPETRFLGLTATEIRADGNKLLFDRYAYRFPLADAILDGWLVPISSKITVVKSLDLSPVSVSSGGDLKTDQLAELMESERPSWEIASATLGAAGDRKVLGFAVSVRQARLLSDICNAIKPKCSQWICGDRNEFPVPVRREMLQKFAAGEVQVTWNVGVLTEGFDDPTIEVIACARPTTSTALYQQILGRGTRPLPGVVDDPALKTSADRADAIAAGTKPHILVLDFVDNSRRHDLVTALNQSILGGRYTEAEIEQAKQDIEERTARGEAEVDAERALAEARRKLEEEEERRRQQIRELVEVNVNYALIDCDPFDASEKGLGRKIFAPKGKPVTEKQAKWLVSFGINPASVNRKQAQGIINQIRQGKLKKRTPLHQPHYACGDDVNRMLLGS